MVCSFVTGRSGECPYFGGFYPWGLGRDAWFVRLIRSSKETITLILTQSIPPARHSGKTLERMKDSRVFSGNCVAQDDYIFS